MQTDSMVEIKHTSISPASHTAEEDRFRLVYSKSKVYVNPTAYARDNIPGFVALVKRVRACPPMLWCLHADTDLQEAVNPTYLLAWIPESLLNEKGSTEW